MKSSLSLLLTCSVVSLGLAACTPAQRSLQAEPGTYENTTSSTDANGTETTRESTTEVSVDADGNKKAVVKSETTRDPRGLFNKTTTSKTSTATEENY